MARNIEDLFVRLKLEGFENLDKIKGSFRELNKVTGFTETEVSNLRKEVLEFGKAAGNTEAVTKGVISVLQGLRTQADLCGNAYAQLTNDLKRLNEAARGSTDTLEKQRQALLSSADAGRQNVDSLQRQIDALKQLQRETRPGSSAFIQLGKDIDAVTVKLGKLKSEAQAFNLALNQQAGATPSVLNNQIAILQRGLQNVRYDAEQFIHTLRQIQLLQITQSGRTGRAGVIASFEAYQSREYLRGFADPSRLPEMPDTLAAIRLRISEINSELENITGYRRRRDLTLELKDLNRQLKNSVLDVTSQEDLALQRLRARVAAQRELNRASGFLAFSRKVSGGEYDPAITRSVEKARRSRGLFSPEQQAVINETTAQLERSSIDASNAVREATTRNVQLEIRALQLKNEEADRLNAELIASNKRVADAEVAAFDRLLAARDRYATSKGFAKQYLGLSGQELSPFYQQVVELGIGAAGTQAGKYQKRDFKRVLTDTIDAFNLQLTESGRTAVEGMGYFKEAAIAHAGGSEKVRRVLDRWDKDAIPANMFPLAGEQGDAYRRRIEEGSNLFKQVIDAFRNTLNRSGKTLSTSADQIRDSAVSFAAQAGRGKEVSTALGRFGAAGNIPMFMLPGTGENPETYATRIAGAAPVQIPQLGDVRQSSLRKLLEMQQLLQEIRNDVPPIGKEFANLDRQISQSLNKIDREIGRRQGTGRLSGMQLAQGVGAALSGGIFGGPEGLIGGAAGLAVGGVGGAFAGAAFGAQLGMARQSVAAAATYAAEIRRLQLALQGIVTSFDDYRAALTAVESTSRMFNTPIREATQQFTKLSAAVIGSGGSIKDAETTFKGLTASVLATGGTVEDVNGALVAAAQVFSKGKVSAEELRGQIGERLAGAFALFAEASGRSTQGLDAALKSGEVTIADFVKFTQFSLEKYGRTAQIIASSPEQAGARLDNALKNLQRNIGDSLGPTGAAFQDFATRSINALDKIIKKLVELKAILPGASYYESLVLSGRMSINDLEVLTLKAGSRLQQAQQKNKGFVNFIADVVNPFQSNAKDAVRAQKEVNALEQALINLRRTERETNKERKQRITEEQNTKKEKAASSLLAAIDQREKALAEARVQREEQIAEIRKQSLEQARQLERQFADERRALERELSRTARNTIDINADIARQQRILAGEDPRIVEAEQRIADIYRQARERDIQIKEEFNDRELTRARTVADFQKNAADQINKANVAYAKSVGKIHREYARDVSKALDESSGKAAKRMATATQLLQVLTTLNLTGMYRYQAGFSPVPAEKDRTPEYNQLLQRRDRLEKQLQSRRQSPDATADRFVAAYAAQPQFEDVAGIQPLPITRMQRQAARPLRLREQRYPERTTVDTALNNSVLRRIERMQQFINNWDPIESQWKEINNNLRETKRSRPASSVPPAVLLDIAKRMWSGLLPAVRDAGGLGGSRGRVRSELDLSSYLNDKQLRILKQGLRDTLEPAYIAQVGIKKQPEAFTRAVAIIAPMFKGFFRDALMTLLETEAAQGRAYAEKTLNRLGKVEARASRAPDPNTIEERFNRLFNQPNIVPGVGKDFEGASLRKRSRNFGQVATTSLQGLLARTGGAGGPVPLPVSGYTGAQGASNALQTGQQEQNKRDAVLKLTTEQVNQLRVLIDQSVRLEDQNKLYQLQQKYIRDGIRPALVDTYAQADLEAARLKVTNAELTPIIDEQVRKIKELASAYEDAQQAARFAQDTRVGKGLREGAMQYVQSIGTVREATSQLAQTGIKGVEDALFSLVTTGTANFREFAASILKDTARMIIQQFVLRSVLQAIGAIGGGASAAANPLANFNAGAAAYMPNALGAAYAANGIQPFARGGAFSHGVTAYAMGGVVKRPTMFAFANGGAGRLGLMGEAGPEAIMPLRRLPSGRLGVESAGGGGMNVVVNVDASGSQVQGNSADASQLGKVLSAAVQQELINQQRPGGLLAPKR